ncbi:MAG: O-methyltransferase [Pseudomonadota bacterium]
MTDRPHRMLNITRDTGEFLQVLVKATRARRVLEIGTSNGYSTLWLAQGVESIGGHVTTVELADYKLALAARNFERSGLGEFITQRQGEAGAYLASIPEASVDLVFLDSQRADYVKWWPSLQRVLSKHGLVVVDNALSHADEMAPFVALVEATADFSNCTVPVGNGQFLATRVPRSS